MKNTVIRENIENVKRPLVSFHVEMLELVRDAIKTDAFKDRLRKIHMHYPNSKSEGRYRDALLEVFNEQALERAHGDHTQAFRAYAEVNKVDLVITAPRQAERLHIEFKLHFTYDIAVKIANALKKPAGETGRTDLDAILRDCDRTNPDKECHAFILIVQDSRHATLRRHEPHQNAARADWNKACPAHAIPDERGIPINFLNDQEKLSRGYPGRADDHEYEAMWTGPLHDLIQRIKPGRKIPWYAQQTIRIDAHPDIPLTSHIYLADLM